MALDIPTLPADAPTPELLAALDKCGAVIVENFLTREITRTLNVEFDRLAEAEACREQGFVNPIIADFSAIMCLTSRALPASPQGLLNMFCYIRCMRHFVRQF